MPKKLVVRQGAYPLVSGIKQEILVGGGPSRMGAINMSRDINPHGLIGESSAQFLTQALFDQLGTTKNTRSFCIPLLKYQIPLARHDPGNLSMKQLIPPLPKFPLQWFVRLWPSLDVDQQRPFGELLILQKIV
jgi:hypothetical protein